MSTLSFLSLNVERDKHLERVEPFLTEKMPEVACFQEITQQTFLRFQEKFGYAGLFAPMLTLEPPAAPLQEGIAILTKLPFQAPYLHGYENFTQHYPQHKDQPGGRPQSVLLSLRVEKEGNPYTLATTHFTWTPDGQPSEEQRVNLVSLMKRLEQFSDIILCGDFNAPRGGEIFSALADHYTDNIPAEVTTTMDANLHRVKNLQLVVDALFTSPHYSVSNVHITDGLSDHCAVTACITRK